MPSFLHVGCGPKRKDRTTPGFNRPEWTELRLDIDAGVAPDIVADMTDMAAVDAAAVDAVFSCHNIEHLHAHEVPRALAEFRRVLKPGGFAVIACPDLQLVAAAVAEGRIAEPLYESGSGPITPLDIIYGHRASIEAGNLYMAHRNGFTLRSLADALLAAGFAQVTGKRRRPAYELWMAASRDLRGEDEMQAIADAHFPA